MHLLSEQDERYPELLREISSRPALLYYRGTLPETDAVMIAAVGTRKITTYGRSVIPNLLGPLIDAGIILVSGLAYGVDAAVHTEVLHRRRPTVAVLGSGIDDKTLYPKEHALLAADILDAGGCILSEYPPGTPGYKQNFVARNRIIAGLSVGTIIIECDLKSGSLITAQFALEQNRRVYAVPGPIYAAESRGPNNLIKMGAQLVTESSDILQDLNITESLAPEPTGGAADSPAEAIVLGLLSSSPVAADELVARSGLVAATLSTALTLLEMKGRIKNVGGQQYIKVR
jgi:DNA processing protein